MHDSLTIRNISWRNFRSYGNNITTLTLGKPGVTTITGRIIDKTTHGNTNNGVGKSTIAEALTWCLFDKSISGVKVDELINNVNQKNMEVTVEFNKSGKDYVVSRYRKLGKSKSNGVRLMVNGVDNTLDSVANTNIELERIIGVPFDTFVLIVVITASTESFLDRPVKSASGSNQTDFFEWMFNLSLLTEKADALKDRIRTTNDRLKELMIKVDFQRQSNERYQRSVAQVLQRIEQWNINQQQSISEAQQDIEHLQSIDAEQQAVLIDLQVQVKERINGLKQTIGEISTACQQSTTIVRSTTRELEHLVDKQCPYCLQNYESTEAKIRELMEIVDHHQQLIDNQEPQLVKLNNQLAKQVDKMKTIVDAIVIDPKRLSKLSEDLAVAHSKFNTLIHTTNPMIDIYDELINNPPEDTVIDLTEINQLDRLIKHQEFLYKLLTKKDSFVRKNLLAKAVPFLNSRLQYYLSMLDSEYKVEFNLELGAKVSAFGKEMSYKSLSNGQKAKINIVIPFAFRDVLQQMYGQINVCICDEVLDFGLDDTGVTLAANMIRTIAKEQNTSIYVISHKAAASEGYFDHQIIIEMEKRFSNIVHQ